MLPKATLAGLGSRLPCMIHLPESGIVRAGTFEMMVRFPLAAPAAVGAKVTVKEILLPGAMVVGRDNPARLKPLPLTESAEIVMLAAPLLVNVSP